MLTTARTRKNAVPMYSYHLPGGPIAMKDKLKLVVAEWDLQNIDWGLALLQRHNLHRPRPMFDDRKPNCFSMKSEWTSWIAITTAPNMLPLSDELQGLTS